MIKLLDILENRILVPRRSKEERQKTHIITLQKKIQQYIKDGSKGDLNLYKTPITSLPDNLKVGGYLNLMGTPITSLPDNLEVEGYLNLMSTPLASLPNNLEVGGYLDLYKTPITSLPNNLKVGGYLNLMSTSISQKYSEEEIRKMVPGVRGKILI